MYMCGTPLEHDFRHVVCDWAQKLCILTAKISKDIYIYTHILCVYIYDVILLRLKKCIALQIHKMLC